MIDSTSHFSPPTAIRHAMSWNRTQQQRATRDANGATRVPRSATKRVYLNGRPHDVPLTVPEYRDSRLRDAARFANNILGLEARL